MSAPERRDPQDAVFAPEELLRALPTPCYVYDEAQLRTRAARLRSAFSSVSYTHLTLPTT